ncbi:MAG: site-specific integrase [Oscillospiraceae bacterium]|nr:site-specific integrase [Oscillospiraceae bacterium]
MPRKKKEEVRLPKIEQLPSGAFHTRVMIGDRRISITKDTRDECVAEYLALKHGVLEVKAQEKKGIKTLEQAVTEYIDSRRGYRSPSTIYYYERYKKNTFQSMMKQNVHAVTDEQWQSAIRQEKTKGRSPKYIENAWSLMASAIEAATGRRPKVLLYPEEKNERAYLEPDEIDIFVAAIKGQPVEIPALLCLSSLRRSEMLALKWDKVDFKKKVIYIQGARVRGEDGLADKKQNKNDSSRRAIPIIPPLLEALQKAERKSEYVVTMTGDLTLTRVKQVCEANNITVVDLHGLRHSFASLAYHLQIPEMIAAEIGGWNDLSTMHKIYTHLAQKDIEKRSRDFSDYFDPEKRKKATK